MKRTLVIVMTSALLLGGCQSTALLYVHDTSVGINVAAGTEGTAKVSFGYDRETLAIVPKNKAGSEAMSLAGTSCVYSSPWGSRIQFTHIVATGAAAKETAAQFAKTEADIAEFAGLAQKGGVTCD